MLEERDLEGVRALRNDPTTWRNLTDVRLITAPMQERWFAKISEATDRAYFVVCYAARPDRNRRCDEIAGETQPADRCDIAPELAGHKYGSLARSILTYCFDFLHLPRVCCS